MGLGLVWAQSPEREPDPAGQGQGVGIIALPTLTLPHKTEKLLRQGYLLTVRAER